MQEFSSTVLLVPAPSPYHQVHDLKSRLIVIQAVDLRKKNKFPSQYKCVENRLCKYHWHLCFSDRFPSKPGFTMCSMCSWGRCARCVH